MKGTFFFFFSQLIYAHGRGGYYAQGASCTRAAFDQSTRRRQHDEQNNLSTLPDSSVLTKSHPLTDCLACASVGSRETADEAAAEQQQRLRCHDDFVINPARFECLTNTLKIDLDPSSQSWTLRTATLLLLLMLYCDCSRRDDPARIGRFASLCPAPPRALPPSGVDVLVIVTF